MKKLILSLLTGMAIFLAGCFETTDEVTLNEDGSGVFVSINDMSAVIAVAKQMGGKDAEKMDEVKVDSTMSLASQVDSIPNLSQGEKELMRKGTMRIKLNLKEDKAVFTLKFPFSHTSEIAILGPLSSKIMNSAMKDKLGGESTPMGEMPEPSSFDNYFDLSYEKGKIVKKLNKEKYSKAESDEYLKGMKEAGAMGISISNTQVINLPRPAKKAEGKNVKLSDDKKKVTIKSDIDDFFDEPSKMEYSIEY
jgi:hypothetical protein